MERRDLDGGRYHLARLIGTGGTADVYEARDAALNRTVAVKLIHPRVAEDHRLAARLRTEIGISRELSHPCIVELYDASRDDLAGSASITYLVMEYMAGGDLRRRLLDTGTLPGTEIERIGRALLSALDVAHARGVIHRDLKPRNVLFSESGVPKVADFGLARSVSAAGLFEDGSFAGTPEYAAPETIASSLWDARSDLYALGCTLYEAAVGEPPFTANTPAEVLRRQVESAAPPLDPEFRSANPRLAALIEALLRKDPNDRPQTAGEALGILSDDESRSIVAAGSTEPCPACGAPMSPRYRWCFTCGEPSVPAIHDRRGYSILITGPGKTGDKARPELRDSCCEIATSVGLDPGAMKKHVPRVPFVLARGVDKDSALRISDRLRAVGADVTLVGPGTAGRAHALRTVGRKALVMTPRIYLVMVTMSGVWITNLARTDSAAVSLVVIGTLLAAVPVVLGGVFSRAAARWIPQTDERDGPNVRRLLGTVRDPLIHARMKSITEAAHLLATAEAGDTPEAGRKLREWADAIAERAAGLGLALDAVRTGQQYAGDASAPEGFARTLDAVSMRTLELIGRSALEVRELALTRARLNRSGAAGVVARLSAIAARLGDEGEAWREIGDLHGGRA